MLLINVQFGLRRYHVRLSPVCLPLGKVPAKGVINNMSNTCRHLLQTEYDESLKRSFQDLDPEKEARVELRLTRLRVRMYDDDLRKTDDDTLKSQLIARIADLEREEIVLEKKSAELERTKRERDEMQVFRQQLYQLISNKATRDCTVTNYA